MGVRIQPTAYKPVLCY